LGLGIFLLFGIQSILSFL